MQRLATLIVAGLLIAPAVKMSSAAGSTKPAAGPTIENALDAAKELAQAMRTNDADAFCRLLDPDWAVVTGNGDIAKHGSSSFGCRKTDLGSDRFQESAH